MNFVQAISAYSPVLAYYLLTINMACFTAMGMDKYKATRQKWRISEKMLFILALAGGSLGGVLGIYAFRHKTRHRKFTLGFPAIMVVQVVILLYVTGFVG